MVQRENPCLLLGRFFYFKLLAKRVLLLKEQHTALKRMKNNYRINSESSEDGGEARGNIYRIYFVNSYIWGINMELFLSRRKLIVGKKVDVQRRTGNFPRSNSVYKSCILSKCYCFDFNFCYFNL